MSRLLICSLILACSLGLTAPAQMHTVLLETWTGVTTLPNANWYPIADDNKSFPIIDKTFGAGAPSLKYYGAINQNAAVVHRTYRAHYSKGLVLEFDVWLAGKGWHYTDQAIILDRNSAPSSTAKMNPLVRLNFNKNEGLYQVQMQILSTIAKHHETLTLKKQYDPDKWNSGRIVVRPDQRVEFWVKRAAPAPWVKIWTTTKTIEPGWDGIASLAVVGDGGSGNHSFCDNIRVSQCVPLWLQETFTGITKFPSTNWYALADDNKTFPLIDPTFGPTAPCVRFWGGQGQNAAIVHRTFRAVYTRGLVLEFDVWLDGRGSHYTDTAIHLDRNPSPTNTRQMDPLVRLNFNKNDGLYNVQMQILSTNPLHQESLIVKKSYKENAWNSGRIVIRPDGKVEFWVKRPDSTPAAWTKLWTTTKTIEPGWDGVAALAVVGDGGRGYYSYCDNIRVHGGGGAWLLGPAAAKIGTAQSLALRAPCDAGLPHVLAASLGNGPIPIGTRQLGLGWDWLTMLSAGGFFPHYFQNYQGALNATGGATATWLVPNASVWKGLTIYHAYVTLDAASPEGIRSISNTISTTIQ